MDWMAVDGSLVSFDHGVIYFPRSIRDNNDLASPPHHSDPSPPSSKSHNPLSAPHPLGYPSTLSSSLGLSTVSRHFDFDAFKAFPIEHDLPSSCSPLLPSQSQHSYLPYLSHTDHLSSLPNIHNASAAHPIPIQHRG